ncbi:MAG TPA: Crp/Fnr family transcriptional regulator [Chitinophaga sp.]|uniref:Crp/Fnr family transcriptional regulator n=1 Tax=Chitinophaga sp. TaxID=1869181 RepID=UPI002BFC0E54|nr:Crp/Fnr family transcriptional regulator [Chitinophaga sp.]HVI47719.1 Crp/Fnr family transcriptional regulator [Chitinophaga sp.]
MHTNLIYAIESFIRLDDQEKEFVKNIFREKHYNRGDYFLQEGQICREVGFILKGVIRYFEVTDGEDKVYEFGQENNFVCNYESFLDHSASAKNIQFIEDAVLLTISYEDLQLLYERVAEGQKFGRLVCEQLYVDAIRKITSLYADSPEERYLRFINSYPDLQQRIPQYYISSFVGVKPQSLSRIRKRMASS